MSAIEQFEQTSKGFTYPQRHQLLKALIATHEAQNSNQLEQLYKEYVRRYPFNFTVWNSYAQLVKTTQSSEAAEKIYQQAVEHNPRSYDLWRCYISSKTSENIDLDQTIAMYQQALASIGNDYNSSLYWEDLINNLGEKFPLNKDAQIAVLKKALAVPSNNLLELSAKFPVLLAQCTPEQIAICYTSVLGNSPAPELSQDTMIQLIKAVIQRSTDAAKLALPEVAAFEAKLTKTEYDGQVNLIEHETWLKYLQFAKAKLNSEQVIFLYEKALITNSDKESLWSDYFNYLDSQGRQIYALQVCKRQEEFLKTIGGETLFLWADLEEMYGSIDIARQLLQLQAHTAETEIDGNRVLRSINRLVQLEKRAKSAPEIILELFNRLLKNISLKSDIRQWAINEQAKYLAQSGNPTQGLKVYLQYFESQPFSAIAFSQLLVFITTSFTTLNETLTQSLADIYLTAIVLSKKASSTDSKNISNMSIHHLRSLAIPLNDIRRIESKIRAAAEASSLTSTTTTTESLLSKRSLSQLLSQDGQVSHGDPQKHLKV